MLNLNEPGKTRQISPNLLVSGQIPIMSQVKFQWNIYSKILTKIMRTNLIPSSAPHPFVKFNLFLFRVQVGLFPSMVDIYFYMKIMES